VLAAIGAASTFWPQVSRKGPSNLDQNSGIDPLIAAIRDKTNVSRIAEELLRGWLETKRR
jgi:hypothetical protein